ncbi:MAG TPA: SoxR reducing system RseC family protein [Azospirillaceae bacterium]|nr:SoxR reducing system RseC family protein [Azospirillaceae bacterium]
MAPNRPDASSRTVVEGVARVVAVDGDHVWLEPEPASGCGGCHSAAACGVQSGSNRLATRRFALVNDFDGRVDDRVVVGVFEGTLLRVSTIAYAVPLLAMIVGGAVGQGVTGSDGGAIVGAVVGLVIGLGAAGLRAKRLSTRGDLSPHFLRRAYGPEPGGDCHLD